jgi:hypothetical protein
MRVRRVKRLRRSSVAQRPAHVNQCPRRLRGRLAALPELPEGSGYRLADGEAAAGAAQVALAHPARISLHRVEGVAAVALDQALGKSGARAPRGAGWIRSLKIYADNVYYRP